MGQTAHGEVDPARGPGISSICDYPGRKHDEERRLRRRREYPFWLYRDFPRSLYLSTFLARSRSHVTDATSCGMEYDQTSRGSRSSTLLKLRGVLTKFLPRNNVNTKRDGTAIRYRHGAKARSTATNRGSRISSDREGGNIKYFYFQL